MAEPDKTAEEKAAADAAAAAEAKAAADKKAADDAAAAKVAADKKAAGSDDQTDWRDRRIAQLTAQKNDLARKLEEEAKKVKPDPAAAKPAVVDDAEVDRRASAKASEMAVVNEFNRQCQEVANAGRLAFPDFDGKVKTMYSSLVGKGSQEDQVKYNTMLMAAMEAGDAHQLLYELAGDLNEAARVMDLTPMKMAVEFAKRATAVDNGGRPSGAPKPIKPVGGRGATHEAIAPDDPERSDKLSTREWMARRSKQAAERGIA